MPQTKSSQLRVRSLKCVPTIENGHSSASAEVSTAAQSPAPVKRLERPAEYVQRSRSVRPLRLIVAQVSAGPDLPPAA